MEYLRGNKQHPKNIEVMVRNGMHYRPPEWVDGSYGPRSRLFVSEAELAVASHILERIGDVAAPQTTDRGNPGSQRRGRKKADVSGAEAQPEV